MIHTIAIAALAVGLTMMLVDRVQRRPAGFELIRDTGYLIVGRDHFRDRQVGIELGLGVRQAVEPGEIRWRLYGHLAWNWPRLEIHHWHEPSKPPGGEWLARRWTGRETISARLNINPSYSLRLLPP